MNNIESERRWLTLGLPASSWWRLHWTLAGAAAVAGRHQRSSQHGARQAREEGDSCWGWAWPWAGTATTTQPWYLGHAGKVLVIHITHTHYHAHANKNQFKCSFYVLNFCKHFLQKMCFKTWQKMVTQFWQFKKLKWPFSSLQFCIFFF